MALLKFDDESGGQAGGAGGGYQPTQQSPQGPYTGFVQFSTPPGGRTDPNKPGPPPPSPTPPPTPGPEAPQPPAPTPNPEPPQAPAPTPAPYWNQMKGFDWTKFNDPGHQTIKYQFARLAAKYPATQQGFQQLVNDPEFKKLGLQSVGNGNIRLPDGSMYDVMLGYNAGGQGWWWGQMTGPNGAALPQDTGQGGTGGATGYVQYSGATGGYPGASGGYGYGFPPSYGGTPGTWNIPGFPFNQTNEFTDPTTQALEALLNNQIKDLSQPLDDQARTQYANLLQQYITSLSQPNAAFDSMMQTMGEQAKAYQAPNEYENALSALIPQYSQLPPEFEQQAKQYISELQAEPFTGAEWEMYRTGALDPIENDRQAAKKRVMAQAAQQGLAPSSGTVQQMLLEVDRAADAQRAAEQGTMGRARVDLRQQRRGQAFDIEQALVDLLQNRQQTGVGMAGALSGSKESRKEKSAQMYGTLAELPQAKQQQQLSAAQALAALSQMVRDEEQSRRSTAMALQGQLSELPYRSLQAALAAMGMGEMPSSVMNSLIGLANSANQKQYFNSQQNQNLWTGLGSLLGYWNQGKSGGTQQANPASAFPGYQPNFSGWA